MTTALKTQSTKKLKTVRYAAYIASNIDGGGAADLNFVRLQRQAIETYLSEERFDKSVHVSDIYEDIGHSGGPTKRPALRRLFADVKARKMDYVVIYNSLCITRSPRHLVLFARYFEQCGVRTCTTGPMLRFPENQYWLKTALKRGLCDPKLKKMSPLPETTRIAIYLHGRPGTNSSPEHLDFQRKEIECFLHIWRLRVPASVVETYEDVDSLNGDSGQPALRRLLADMDSGKFDCVVAYNLERLGQTLVTYEQLLARFKKCGLGLVTPQPWIFHVLGRKFLDITGWHPLSSHPRAIAIRRRWQMEVEKVENAMRTKCLKADGRDDLLQYFERIGSC